MDKQMQIRMQGILVKDVEELTGRDIAFLKARRDYLTSEQLSKFKKVLGRLPRTKKEPVAIMEDKAEEVVVPETPAVPEPQPETISEDVPVDPAPVEPMAVVPEVPVQEPVSVAEGIDEFSGAGNLDPDAVNN